jgi:hypothetical protein
MYGVSDILRGIWPLRLCSIFLDLFDEEFSAEFSVKYFIISFIDFSFIETSSPKCEGRIFNIFSQEAEGSSPGL